jgi:hypothetical protein
MSRSTLTSLALVVAAALFVAACGAASGSPSPSTPAPTATPSGIAHPTGVDEIVLRYDVGGGFVPIEFFAAHVPQFTLYGDGTVVFVSNAASSEPAPNGPSLGPVLRTARLAESQVQSLLEFALRDGALAIARTEYQNPNVADAPTTTFEIHADGDTKTVSVMALGLDAQSGPDVAILTALGRLADRLGNFDQGGSLASNPYVPTAYRGVLFESNGVQGVPVQAWPWPSLAPADFKLPADANVLQQRTRVLSPDAAAATGIQGFERGIVAGLWYQGPDGATYSFVLRPLLPDEAA